MSDDKKRIKITWPHGEVCEIPASIVAKSRASYYATHDEGKPTKANSKAWNETYDKEFNYTMSDDYELTDWLSNNMDWKDVKNESVFTVMNNAIVNYKEKWSECELEVI